MKPNEQQKQWLQDYLRSVLTYEETYEEVYDHVLTALNDKPHDNFFEPSVMTILEEDFGGNNGLLKLDDNFERGVSAEINTRYNSYFNRKLVKVPRFIYLIALGFIIFQFVVPYYLYPVGAKVLFFYANAVVVFTWLAPLGLLAISGIKIGFLFKNAKASAKDHVFRKIVFRPIRYFMYWFVYEGICVSILSFMFKHYKEHPSATMAYANFLSIQGHIIGATVFILSVTHAVAFYNLYIKHFKVVFTR